MNRRTHKIIEWTVFAVVMAILGVFTPDSDAQTAPAGNAHPQHETMDDAEALANPFGPRVRTTFDLAGKEAFAKKVDLSPLRDLAVYHSSRVKILDTLARETVKQIVGRKDYVDFDVTDENEIGARQVHYDPLFTYLDLMIDPGYYVDRPLVHVEFLPLREAFLLSAYPDFTGNLAQSEPGRQFDDALAALASSGKVAGADAWLKSWRSLAPAWNTQARKTDAWRNTKAGLEKLTREMIAWARTQQDDKNGTKAAADQARAAAIAVKDLVTREDEREYRKRLGRLRPSIFVESLDPVTRANGMTPGFAPALDRVRTALLLFQHSWKNLVMVASDGPEKPWAHLASLPADSPASVAAKELGEGWRAGDAARVNAAAKTLAAELPKINSAYYPTTKRALEAAYNRANPFEWGYWLYALALLTLLLAFGTGRKWLVVAGVTTLAAALGMHGFGFISRCIIAERFAIQNQFESMTGLSLFAGVVGTTIMLMRRQWLFGAAAAGVGFMVLITATQTNIPGVSVEREAPILNTSVLLKYHVTTVLVSYGLISLGFMVSLFYLGTHYAAKLRGRITATPKLAMAGGGGGGGEDEDSFSELSASALNIGENTPHSTARVLHDLDKSQMIILQLAFWALGVGILLGAWWADHSWGRWWAFDPKELWALVTWLVYLVVIHIRFASISNRALVTAWLSVLGFIVMLWTYFGVNLILPGLHAYA